MIKLDLYELLNKEANVNKCVMKKFYHSSIKYMNINSDNINEVLDSRNSRPDCYDIKFYFEDLSGILKKCVKEMREKVSSNSVVVILAIKNNDKISDGLYYIDFIEKLILRYSDTYNVEKGIKEGVFCFYYLINVSMYQETNCSQLFLRDVLLIGELKNIIKTCTTNANKTVNEFEFNAFKESKSIGVNINYMYLISADKVF
jgi:hypothetical protein